MIESQPLRFSTSWTDHYQVMTERQPSSPEESATDYRVHDPRYEAPTNAGDYPHVGWADDNPPVVSAPQARPKGRGATREIIETLVLALLIFLAVRLVVLNFKVDGNSMRPNLLDQELLLVNRNAFWSFDLNGVLDRIPGVDPEGEWTFTPFHPPERGDIVVFNPPNGSGEPYIKRVIAVEGETVEIRDGSVYVDGIELEEPYIDEGITECLSNDCDPITLGEGEVYVLGDNRRNSSDSRSFGPVPIENLIGQAWLVYWPLDEAGIVPHYDYPEIADR